MKWRQKKSVEEQPHKHEVGQLGQSSEPQERTLLPAQTVFIVLFRRRLRSETFNRRILEFKSQTKSGLDPAQYLTNLIPDDGTARYLCRRPFGDVEFGWPKPAEATAPTTT